ncbi:hypothetical protein WAX74_15015 [Psychrobacillus sp. FJAT-51614]|uniref:Lipoprotein n=1 Tax=Psychrobacillus mangrovi TaxID=3117745 RepID=A0ABU8F7E9_9BACI
MKKIWAFILILLCLAGCSNKDEMNVLMAKYESQIGNQQEEIQELKKEIKQLETEYADYSSNLQQADYESRRIMRFISESEFDELKKEYNIEFEVKDGAIDFGVPESNSSFPIELAGNPMFIASLSKFPEGTDINYFVDDLENEKRHLINVSFDKDMKFEFIFVGGE